MNNDVTEKTDADASVFGGDGEDRTLDLCVANAALSQLSYAPVSPVILP